MKMDKGNEKYDKVLGILRNAEPVLTSADEIAERVLKTISRETKHRADLSEVLDFIFSWTYIPWVRRSLVTASVFLVIMFVFQQSLIMKQIIMLSRQIGSYEQDASIKSGEYPDLRMMFLRSSERRFPLLKKRNKDKELKELFRTIEQLKKEYKGLDTMIRNDPELKRLIEKKLSEIDGNKMKI